VDDYGRRLKNPPVKFLEETPCDPEAYNDENGYNFYLFVRYFLNKETAWEIEEIPLLEIFYLHLHKCSKYLRLAY
jgi:hypothetical protein